MNLEGEQLRRAWERNGPWVQKRYNLEENDLEELQRLGVIPLPQGDILIPPQIILELNRRLEKLQAAIEHVRKRYPRRNDDDK